MAREYISKDNLSKFASLVKGSINTAQSTANTAKTNAANAQKTADNAVTAAAGALAEAQKKVAAVKTINGKSLTGSGNLTLGDLGIDTTLCEVVTALPDASTAKSGRIYLVKSAASGTDNVFKEYVRLSKNDTLPSGQTGLVFYWEQLGEWKANVDLSPYAKKTDLTKSAVGLGNVDNTSDAAKPISTATKSALDGKVDKVSGKGLSTNDFTAAYKTKLDGIATGATKITVDSALSTTSTNPVQNKAVNAALGGKVSTATYNSLAFSPDTPFSTSTDGQQFIGLAFGDNDKHDNKGTVEIYTATQSKPGIMSTADKKKLDGIAEGANKYSLPAAKSDALGGVKVKPVPSTFTVQQQDSAKAAMTATQNSNRFYPVQIFGDNLAFVNVPWTDNNTTYGVASTSANGLMSKEDKTKLNGIAAGATKVLVDSALSPSSTNALQNKVVSASLAAMQDSIDGKVDSSEFTALTDDDITTLWNNAK